MGSGNSMCSAVRDPGLESRLARHLIFLSVSVFCYQIRKLVTDLAVTVLLLSML